MKMVKKKETTNYKRILIGVFTAFCCMVFFSVLTPPSLDFLIGWILITLAVLSIIYAALCLRHTNMTVLPVIVIIFSSGFLLLTIVVAFGYSTLPSYGVQPTTISDQGTIEVGYYISQEFDIYYGGNYNVIAHTDDDANFYIFEPNEYLRYETGSTDQTYYFEASLNAMKMEISNLYIPEGTYYLVIEPVNDVEVEYDFTIESTDSPAYSS